MEAGKCRGQEHGLQSKTDLDWVQPLRFTNVWSCSSLFISLCFSFHLYKMRICAKNTNFYFQLEGVLSILYALDPLILITTLWNTYYYYRFHITNMDTKAQRDKLGLQSNTASKYQNCDSDIATCNSKTHIHLFLIFKDLKKVNMIQDPESIKDREKALIIILHLQPTSSQ